MSTEEWNKAPKWGIFEEFIQKLPEHEQDQMLASMRDSENLIKRSYVNYETTETRPLDEIRAALIEKWFPYQSLQPCKHLKLTKHNYGHLFAGISRTDVLCGACVARIPSTTLLRVTADNHCEVCLEPTMWFHGNTVPLIFGFGPTPEKAEASTVVIIHVECCPKCNAELLNAS